MVGKPGGKSPVGLLAIDLRKEINVKEMAWHFFQSIEECQAFYECTPVYTLQYAKHDSNFVSVPLFKSVTKAIP